MKKSVYIATALFIFAAGSLSNTACSKKEQAAAPSSQPTAIQQQAIEEVKKDVIAAKAANAAMVNGVEITVFDLVREMNRIAPSLAKKGSSSKNTTAVIRKQALDNLITRELVVQQAIREGMKADPEQIDKAIGLMKDQMGEKEFQTYLDERGSTEKEIKKKFERNQLFETITAREIFGKVAVDDQELRADYEKNKNRYKDDAGRQLKHEEVSNFIRKKLIAEKGSEKLVAWGRALQKDASVVMY